MSKVTIIVPIYNVEEYVAKCLDSLLRQTYSDYVIYAVNDGSPKNEQPIIDRYAAAYPEKVVAIRKENGGYGSVLEMAIARLDSEGQKQKMLRNHHGRRYFNRFKTPYKRGRC